ncbi:MAG: class I SAM-dependent methyltransferase family protein [Candidatus Thorarchaeota archaeon]|nr:class I SAM-dependent methyltransferase family protein [Candidatus Thorarchaeota archaeon]
MMDYSSFLRTRLSGLVPEDAKTPPGYHLVGHVALLRIDEQWMPFAEEIGRATLDYSKRIRSVAVREGPTAGVFRVPQYRVVAGSRSTETTHTEFGVHYRLDPTRITFSPGNLNERRHMARLVQKSERVVDMFACVGQFSLPIARIAGAEVTSIEINPEAYSYLLEGIRLNGLQRRVHPILGDCRDEHPVGEADRVLLGYLHKTEDYLPHALSTLRETGGWIHLHRAIHPSELSSFKSEVIRRCEDHGFTCTLQVRHIKTYSMGVVHIVLDIAVSR